MVDKTLKTKELYLPQIIGKGYGTYWNYKGRYKCCKGGRGSKKSYTTALWIIYKMMEYPLANTLVMRYIFGTHRDSTFSQLKVAINRLGVSHLWKATTSPMEITYIPHNTKILFRGLDDPLKITSISVEHGHLCWVWWEEAYQCECEEDFNKIDMSIRGILPPGYFKQHLITFNPWFESHWLNERFFKNIKINKKNLTEKGVDIQFKDDEVLAMTTNYIVNEFLGHDDLVVFEKMKEHPRRYDVEGLGNWGIAEGLIFENWEELDFDYRKLSKLENFKSAFGLDFGYTNDPTALICALYNYELKEIYIYDEHYQRGMLNDEIAYMIKAKGYNKEYIVADCAEPKSIDEIRRLGVRRIIGSKKGNDTIRQGIQFLQQFKIYIHPDCVNTKLEFKNYIWGKDKSGKATNKPIDNWCHLIDALRYGMEIAKKNNKNVKFIGL